MRGESEVVMCNPEASQGGWLPWTSGHKETNIRNETIRSISQALLSLRCICLLCPSLSLLLILSTSASSLFMKKENPAFDARKCNHCIDCNVYTASFFQKGGTNCRV